MGGFDRKAWGEAAAALFQPASAASRRRAALPASCGIGDRVRHDPAAAQPWSRPSRPPPTSTTWARSSRSAQLRESFILAAGDDGLWIIDQHVAHERVLFEKILRDRQVERVQRQRLLMPLLVELKPEQMVVFARIAEELESNGFEVEPFGPQTLAVKAAPVGLEGAALERMLAEVIEQSAARILKNQAE